MVGAVDRGRGWLAPGADAPWGPALGLWPRDEGAAVAVAGALAVAALGGLEWRRRRELRH